MHTHLRTKRRARSGPITTILAVDAAQATKTEAEGLRLRCVRTRSSTELAAEKKSTGRQARGGVHGHRPPLRSVLWHGHTTWTKTVTARVFPSIVSNGSAALFHQRMHGTHLAAMDSRRSIFEEGCFRKDCCSLRCLDCATLRKLAYIFCNLAAAFAEDVLIRMKVSARDLPVKRANERRLRRILSLRACSTSWTGSARPSCSSP